MTDKNKTADTNTEPQAEAVPLADTLEQLTTITEQVTRDDADAPQVGDGLTGVDLAEALYNAGFAKITEGSLTIRLWSEKREEYLTVTLRSLIGLSERRLGKLEADADPDKALKEKTAKFLAKEGKGKTTDQLWEIFLAAQEKALSTGE